MKGKTLQPQQKTPRRITTSLTWGYLGLAFPLSGCGGRI
jgi:hypothetical protein